MILEGIITRLRTDLGCLKPEMVVRSPSMRGLQTVIEGFKEPKEVLKQDDNADQNYLLLLIIHRSPPYVGFNKFLSRFPVNSIHCVI